MTGGQCAPAAAVDRYHRAVEWSGFFEGLEAQLAAEWESERAALETETERLRVAKLELRTRLHAAAAERASVVVEVPGQSHSGTLASVGADWIGLTTDATFTVIPLASVQSVTVEHSTMLRSALPVPPATLASRVTLGFVCRDLARRRAVVVVASVTGGLRTGTIDRAGADHLDIALHDQHTPRRAADVDGYRMVPFSAVAWIRMDEMSRLSFM